MQEFARRKQRPQQSKGIGKEEQEDARDGDIDRLEDINLVHSRAETSDTSPDDQRPKSERCILVVSDIDCIAALG